MSDLDELLNQFEARKAAEAKSELARRAAEDERSRKTIRVYEAVVLPVLQKFAADLRAKDYLAQVKERMAGHILPGLTLELTPYKSEDRHRHSPSKLSFTQTNAGSIEIRQDVRAKDGGSSLQSFAINETWQLAEISEAKVIERAVGFIAEVLAAN